MSKAIIYIMTLLFTSTLLIQCKAKKPLINDKKNDFSLAKSKADTIVRTVIENNFEFVNLKAKINTKFKSREKQNLAFGTFVKMHKDSVIHVTISKVVPIVIALITPDSIKFINKLDKKYFVGDYSYISKLIKTDISFDQIQSLLIGNPIMMDSTNPNYLIEENDEFFISSLNKEELKDANLRRIGEWSVKHWINELYKAGKMVAENDSTKTKIEIFQADYKKIEGKLFPNRTKVQIITPSDSISIHLNYQRVKINTIVEWEFSIPENYTKYE